MTLFDLDDLEMDMREFDGDEPEMAELVLAGEESEMMELDASHAPVIGGIGESDLLHHDHADHTAGFDHKSAEDSVGMYLREIGRVVLPKLLQEVLLLRQHRDEMHGDERVLVVAEHDVRALEDVGEDTLRFVLFHGDSLGQCDEETRTPVGLHLEAGERGDRATRRRRSNGSGDRARGRRVLRWLVAHARSLDALAHPARGGRFADLAVSGLLLVAAVR